MNTTAYSAAPSQPDHEQPDARLSEIESDIEATRRDLDATLNALQERLSPRRRMEAAADAARASVNRAVHEGAGFAREHSQSLLIIGGCIAVGLIARLIVQARLR
jgi:hypothetical protein